jgi:hypothetical protein
VVAAKHTGSTGSLPDTASRQVPIFHIVLGVQVDCTY